MTPKLTFVNDYQSPSKTKIDFPKIEKAKYDSQIRSVLESEMNITGGSKVFEEAT